MVPPAEPLLRQLDARLAGIVFLGPLGDTPEVEHPVLSAEYKSRETLPGWLLDALEQVRTASQKDGRGPMAVSHRSGRHCADSLGVLGLKYLLRLLGKPPGKKPNGREAADDAR